MASGIVVYAQSFVPAGYVVHAIKNRIAHYRITTLSGYRPVRLTIVYKGGICNKNEKLISRSGDLGQLHTSRF